MRSTINGVGIGFGVTGALFVVLGGVTGILPNPLFIRMTAIQWHDYLFLLLTSVLSGIYCGVWYHKKKTRRACNYVATGGVFGGLFSFGCAVCNKLLVLLLGVSGVMTYFMPFQPFLGMTSVGLLSYGIYKQVKG